MHNYRTPTDALSIIASASNTIIALAKEVGIDASTLLQLLPASNALLKGSCVPVIHKKYRGACSVLLHINQTERGEYWPFLRFSTFKHGGLTAEFNGLTWLKEQNSFKQTSVDNSASQYEKKAKPFINSTISTDKVEEEKRLSRFINLQENYRIAKPLTIQDAWLKQRLMSYASPTLLARINVKRTANALLFPLYHDQYEHTGFHKIINMKNEDKKFHFAKKTGVFTGSYIKVSASSEFAHLPIALCEGVVTGLSLGLVWPGEIRIALSANNLLPVRKSIKQSVVIFCDEDVWKQKVGNVGRQAAMKAKQGDDLVQGPRFHFTSLGKKPTDFNDLLCLEGLSAMNNQIGDVLVSRL
ncbi:MAG: putative DNA primase/helicase [Psychroserpens sp.]|jgi:putative DNA primase/helicase